MQNFSSDSSKTVNQVKVRGVQGLSLVIPTVIYKKVIKIIQLQTIDDQATSILVTARGEVIGLIQDLNTPA
jgi:predicted transcriptional regulator